MIKFSSRNIFWLFATTLIACGTSETVVSNVDPTVEGGLSDALLPEVDAGEPLLDSSTVKDSSVVDGGCTHVCDAGHCKCHHDCNKHQCFHHCE